MSRMRLLLNYDVGGIGAGFDGGGIELGRQTRDG